MAEMVVILMPELDENGIARVKVGTLDIELDAQSFGRVELDGNHLKIRRLQIDAVPGYAPKVTLDVIV